MKRSTPLLTPQERAWRLVGRVVTVLGLVYLVAPILVVIPLSVTSGTVLAYPMPGLSLRNVHELVSSDLWLSALGRSLLVATAAMAISTTLGTLACIGLVRIEARWRTPILGFLLAPLPIPHVVLGVAFLFFFAPTSLKNGLVQLILAHSMIAIPFVVLPVLAALQGYDPNLTRAAKSLGARPLTVFRRVTLPLILPGVATGAIFSFATSFDELIIALFVTGPRENTLPKQIFSGIRDSVNPTIAVVATVLIAFSVVVVFSLELLRRHGARQQAVAGGE